MPQFKISKLSDIEHVLKPDTYIGSTDKDKTTNWFLIQKELLNMEVIWILAST